MDRIQPVHALLPPSNPRDFSTHIGLGSGASAELLPQLVLPGIDNFARVLSALPKYGQHPRLTDASRYSFKDSARANILIAPDGVHLPSAEKALNYVRNGGALTVLFTRQQARDDDVKRWLDALSLRIVPTRALAFSEYPAFAIEDRPAISAFRLLGYRLTALGSSHLVEGVGNALVQVFHARPQNPDPTIHRGQFTIGFTAEQFSDSAMGDVWEGTVPSFLSRIREGQFAALSNTAASPAAPNIPRPPALQSAHALGGRARLLLPHYVVLKGGQKLFSGTILNPEKSRGTTNLGEDPDGYLAALQADALRFIDVSCPTTDSDGFCSGHFVSADLIEWAVTFSKDPKGIRAIELIHDSKFSGAAFSYNVVFLRE